VSDRRGRVLAGLLVRLYPRTLRDAHGAEMAAFLEVRFARVGGRPLRALRELSGAVRDLVVTWREERWERRRLRETERRREPRMSGLVQDLRYAFRRLARTPVFSLGALLIMAIAIGANTGVFALVNTMLLKAPPYGDADRVVNIYQDSDDGEPSSTSYPAYLDMAEPGGVFAAVGATSPDQVTLEEGGVRQSLAVEFTTSSYMSVIGRQPSRGRWFDASMDRVGAGNYAVVSERTWRTRFGADPSLVGRTLRINREPVTVIGIGPEGFNGVGGFIVTDMWLSISSVGLNGSFRVANLDRREDHWYDVKARLAPGVTVAGARQAMDALAQRLAESFPELNEGRDITVFPAAEVRLHPEVDGDLYSGAGVLMAIVLLVLVLASSNLGSLLLVRGVLRGGEVAVRRALGAPSGRVAGLFLGEALLLSFGGGLLGLIVAKALLGALAAAPLPLPVSGELELTMDLPVLLFSIGLMAATGLFFGWVPALHSLRADVSGALREDRRTGGGGRRLSRVRNVLVGVQVAVSLALVVGAAGMVRSLASYGRVDPGVDVDHLAFIRTTFSEAGIGAEAREPVVSELRDRIAAVPGVSGVALATRLPVRSSGTTTTVVEGYEPAAGTGSVELPWAAVSPEYFETMGIRVLAGRAYRAGDEDLPVVIVNETAARRFWGSVDAVGRRMRPQSVPDGWNQVVGVVGDTKVTSLAEAPTPMIYYALGPSAANALYIMARTSGDPSDMVGHLASELHAVNPGLPVDMQATLGSYIGTTLESTRLTATTLGLFSLLALLLAGIGIYTIVSFTVAGRVQEIGIRVALGAERARVMRLVVGEVALIVLLGLVAGTALVFVANAQLGAAVFGPGILAPGTLAAATAIMAVAVGIAAWLPARRAAAVDPVEALRGA